MSHLEFTEIYLYWSPIRFACKKSLFAGFVQYSMFKV